MNSLYYEYKGQGPTLVLVHGYCESIEMWDFLNPLEQSYSLLKIDLAGFGKSASHSLKSLEQQALAIHQILQKEAIEEFTYIGHSMGGYIGLELLKKVGRLCKGFALFHSHPFADSPETQQKRNRSIEFIQSKGVKPYLKTLIPSFFPLGTQEEYNDEIEKIKKLALRSGPEGIIGAAKGMRDRKDHAETLVNYEGKLGLIIGGRDELVPKKFSQKQMLLADRTALFLHPQLGHMSHIEDEKWAFVVIQSFVEWVYES